MGGQYFGDRHKNGSVAIMPTGMHHPYVLSTPIGPCNRREGQRGGSFTGNASTSARSATRGPGPPPPPSVATTPSHAPRNPTCASAVRQARQFAFPGCQALGSDE